MRKVVLLGASGSIGSQTLDLLAMDPEAFSLVGFSIGHQGHKVKEILQTFKDVRAIWLQDEAQAQALQKEYPTLKVYTHEENLCRLIDEGDVDLVINALVGFVGFRPTYHALSQGIDVALSNKEALVVGGELLLQAQAETGAKIYPIDSEHVALQKCLQGHDLSEVRRLVLTASGGAFRDKSRAELSKVSQEEALQHPSWKMGAKITIDCATMMNKGFELIEAYYLFGLPLAKIDILMHDESKVHSVVEFIDGSYLADIGPSDMHVPIAYALYGAKRHASFKAKSLPLTDWGTFHFHSFDPERYPCVQYAREALMTGGTMPCALNASNEIAVQAFLEGKITFLDIERIIKTMMDQHRVIDHPSVDDLVYVHELVQKEATILVEEVTQ